MTEEMKIVKKINKMYSGLKINSSEKRAVLHVALRMDRDKSVEVEGEGDVVEKVWKVRDKIQQFSEKVRQGKFKGYSGKSLKNVVVIGIGGSYLGPEFVFEALKYDSEGFEGAEGRVLRFLANVDPTDLKRSIEGLNLEETLFIVNSKTFTTAETMLNARTVRSLITHHYSKNPDNKDYSKFVKYHFAA
jgi:glucose-6-phosphate isomerase